MPCDYRARIFARRIVVHGSPVVLPAGVPTEIIPWSVIGDAGLNAADLSVYVEVQAGNPVDDVAVQVRFQAGGPVAENVSSGMNLQPGAFASVPVPAAGREIRAMATSAAGATVRAWVVLAEVSA
jgi:hypothetical protein